MPIILSFYRQLISYKIFLENNDKAHRFSGQNKVGNLYQLYKVSRYEFQGNRTFVNLKIFLVESQLLEAKNYVQSCLQADIETGIFLYFLQDMSLGVANAIYLSSNTPRIPLFLCIDFYLKFTFY